MPSTSLGLLEKHLSAWTAFAGRGLSDEAQSAWVRQFGSIDPDVLGAALELVTSRARRMPWPGDLTEAISVIRNRRSFGHAEGAHTYRKAMAPDPETGATVNVLIDDSCLSAEGPMFKAQDCPEGRAFLVLLRSQGGSSKRTQNSKGRN